MYSVDKATVTTALQSANPNVFNDSTISRILALTTTSSNGNVTIDQTTVAADGSVTTGANSEIAIVTASNTSHTVITTPVNAPVVILQGAGGVDVTVGNVQNNPTHADGVTDRVVIGTSGHDKIVVADSANTQVVLGAAGSTVTLGNGYDTVVAGLGNDTVVGGSAGHTVVRMSGTDTDYKVKVSGKNVVVTDSKDGSITTMSDVHYVQLDNGDALVFAKDTQEASIALLYETVFGRAADKAGLDFWIKAAGDNASLAQIADLFIASPEYKASQAAGNSTDQDFMVNLYKHSFDRAPDQAGLDYWLDALAHGATRAQVAMDFASAATAVVAGQAHTETTIVGSVTIVGDIV